MMSFWKKFTTLSCITASLLRSATASAADAPPNFNDHVLPIFRAKCGTCHSAGQAKGGLVLESYSAAIQGGASGAVIEAGELDNSRLWMLITHQEQPVMPPNQPKLPDDQLKLIEKWISAGALESKDSKPKVKKKVTLTLNTANVTGDKPEGPPPMPENLSTEPLVTSPRGNAITALAASPWAPLLAVSGHQQVLLYNLEDYTLAGVLPFSEGTVHVLRFSRNGSLLLAGGGRGGQSGRVVVFDVKTGKRVFEIGAEPDVVLAADISPNQTLVALGGPKRMVRVFSTADGEQQYEMKKHTDWVTAIEFSPDGVLLATGDRSNGLMVWEANTGREFFALPGHTGPVTSVSWRADSNVVASSSEDSTIRLWEMNNGSQIKSWGAHGQGTASVWYLRDGRLLSTGRDRVTKLSDQNGSQLKVFGGLSDLGLRVTYSDLTGTAITGDWTGTVKIFDAKSGEERATLVSNPPPLQTRLQAAEKLQSESQQIVTRLTAQLAESQLAVTNRKKAAENAKQDLEAAQAAQRAAQTALTQENQNLKVAREKQSAAELQRKSAAEARNKAVAALGEAEKSKKAAAIATAKEALAKVQQELTKADQERDATSQKLRATEKLISERARKVQDASNQVNRQREAADRAQRESTPPQSLLKQISETTAALKTAQAKLDARRAVAAKLTREKQRH